MKRTPLARHTPLRRSRPKSTRERKAARGKPCMVRLVGVCNGNDETTVLCHYRLAGTCGMGEKPPDSQAAWACSSCHDVCDGRARVTHLTHTQIRLAHAEGVMRTQYAIRRAA